MTRIQVTLRRNIQPGAGSAERPRRWYHHLKSALASTILAAGVVGFFLASLLLGSIIAAGILILIVIACLAFLTKKLLGERHPR